MLFGKVPATKASGYAKAIPNWGFGTAPGFWGKPFGKYGKPWAFI